MSQEWMIDILADIRQFAHKNTMLTLAEHLDDAILVAAREIRAQNASDDITSVDDNADRRLHRPAAEHEHV